MDDHTYGNNPQTQIHDFTTGNTLGIYIFFFKIVFFIIIIIIENLIICYTYGRSHLCSAIDVCTYGNNLQAKIFDFATGNTLRLDIKKSVISCNCG